MKQPFIPKNLKTIYPNPAQDVFGTPAVIFRDHRWTLPVIFCACEAGLLSIPVQLVTFDRHRDALTPEAVIEQLAVFRRDEGSVGELIEIVRDSLSPRDDDWIVAGMELGHIADAIQFKSDFKNGVEDDPVQKYLDAQGSIHRLFSMGRPVCELTYHGALVDNGHRAAASGLWETMGWDPSQPDRIAPERDMVCDIDCDFLPFPGIPLRSRLTMKCMRANFTAPASQRTMMLTPLYSSCGCSSEMLIGFKIIFRDKWGKS